MPCWKAALLAALLTLAAALAVPAQAQKDVFGRPAGGASTAPAEAAAPGPLRRLSLAIADYQRRNSQDLSAQVIAIRNGAGLGAVMTVLLISFLYGLFHAAGPGHGKAVVVAYLLTHPASWWSGPVMAASIAGVQAVSALLIVLLLAVFLELGGTEALRQALVVETASYGLLVLLGLALALRALFGHDHQEHGHGHDHHPGHDHGHRRGHDHDVLGAGRRLARLFPRGSAPALALAVGVRPCSGAIIVLLFTLANGLLLLGVGAILVMALGVALSLALLGVLTLGTRKGVARLAGPSRVPGPWLRRGIGLAGALALTTIGALLLAGAADRAGWLS